MNDFERKSRKELVDMMARIGFLVFHGHLDDGFGQIMTSTLKKAIEELETQNDY